LACASVECVCGLLTAWLVATISAGMTFITEVSASSAPLRPIPLRHTSLSAADEDLARRKAEKIHALVSASAASLAADETWDMQYDELVSRRKKLDEHVSKKIAESASSLHAKLEASQKQISRFDAVERTRLTERLAKFEAERLAAAERARVEAENRFLRINRRSKKELIARQELERTQDAGHDVLQEEVRRRHSAGHTRASAAAHERTKAFRQMNEEYSARREALLLKQEDLRQQYERDMAAVVKRHTARAAHVNSVLESKTSAASERAEQNSQKLAETQRQWQSRSAAELMRRTSSMALSSSASASRLQDERERRQKESARLAVQRELTIKANLEQKAREESQREAHARSIMGATSQRIGMLDRNKKVAEHELQARKRKAITVMAQLYKTEQLAACATPDEARNLLRQLPGLA